MSRVLAATAALLVWALAPQRGETMCGNDVEQRRRSAIVYYEGRGAEALPELIARLQRGPGTPRERFYVLLAIAWTRASQGLPRGSEPRSRPRAEGFDLLTRRRLAGQEHLGLEHRTRPGMAGAKALPGRLDHEVDMTRCPVHVGPEAHVHLVGLGELLHAPGRLRQQRPHLVSLRDIEIGHVEAVAQGLHEKRAYAKRADAVLDHPVGGGMDPAAGQLPCSGHELAGETTG